MTPLLKPKSHRAAEQCREMGLAIGDTIQGREECGQHWSDSRLTVIFIGEDVAVFKQQTRNEDYPFWEDCGESADWTLNCRHWHKVTPEDALTASVATDPA